MLTGLLLWIGSHATSSRCRYLFCWHRVFTSPVVRVRRPPNAPPRRRAVEHRRGRRGRGTLQLARAPRRSTAPAQLRSEPPLHHVKAAYLDLPSFVLQLICSADWFLPKC